MKKTLLNGALLLLLIGAVVALVLFWTTMRTEKDDDAAPVVQKKISYMSSDGVEKSIERRLGVRAGRPVTARCPTKVPDAIGTKFRCSVRFAGRDDRIAIAKVRIFDKGGFYTWTSTPLPSDSSTASGSG